MTPLHRRLPTRGFSNDDFERDWYIVNLDDLEKHFENGASVDANALKQARLVPDLKKPIKILGDGALTKKLTVQAGWYSRSAFEKIAAAGGTALNAKGQPFQFPKPKPRFTAQKDSGKQGKSGGKKAKAEQPAKAEEPKQEPPQPEAPKAEAPAAEAPAQPAAPPQA
jgi:hypothetical protein